MRCRVKQNPNSAGWQRKLMSAGAALVAALLLLAAAAPGSAGAAAAAAAHAHTAATPPNRLAPQAPPASQSAQAPAAPSAPAPGSATHDLTATDVAAFLDGIVPYAIRRGNIAGATVAVVANGQILFAKGYGYADVKTRRPVLADATLFRPGSVSKLFTWTAVMQQVQAGKLDLDRDINDYLDFKIPERYGKPITLRDLMTHTAGFEDTFDGSFVKTKGELIPYREYLLKHIPAEIFPPGKIVAYSNYGAMLAGYIVQRVSGEPFDEYIQRHIFQPLGMAHSSFEQPLPAALAQDLSNGYATASDKKPGPFEYVEVAPAGSLSSTATDMAHFMIAQLEGGSYDGASILSPATEQLMHTPQSQMAPGMNGFDLGFYQENRNGLRIIGHAGDTNYFHSDLHLLLDKHVGFFISLNSLGSDGAAEQVRVGIFRAFLDRYFPYTPPVEPTVAHPQSDAARVAGWYLTSRRIESALGLLNVVTQSSVTALPNGEIQVSMLKSLAGTPKTWREVGPLTYREVGGQTHLKFVTNAKGHINYWIADDFLPVMVFQKVHGLRQKGEAIWMGSTAIAVFILTIAIWLGGWIVRRRFNTPLLVTGREKQLRLASRTGVLVILAALAAWITAFGLLLNGDESITGALTIAYILGALGVLGALAIIAEAAGRLMRGPGGWLVRAGEGLLGLCALYGLWAILAFGMALLALIAPALASVHAAAPAPAAPPQLSADDLNAFFGGMVPYAIQRANIAGAAVAVVANGQLLFAKGYGYADLKSHRPVVADQTLFRAGSVSKLFTWTAVMQLVQERRLDLDRDINDYLDFKVPEPYGRPITMRDLMTHSAGFEDTVTDLFVARPSQLFPLRQYLVRHMPPLIFPPGKVVAYSNYGATLAGYIVQRVSGEPFDDYIMRHILQPLGMSHATFQQPLPANLRPLMASGYRSAADEHATPFELVEAAPAGALTTTVADLAKFMVAQLGDGSDGGAQILSPATLQEMHTPQGRPLPGMNGMDLGFYDENRNGLRIIGHGGDTGVFHSDLHLVLGKGVGLVIMLNSTGDAGAAEQVRVAIFRSFLDRYFPYTPPQEATVSDPDKDAARVAGSYGSSRHTALRILTAISQSSVAALPHGRIEESELTRLSGVPKHWREVGPLLWREVDGQAHLRFVAGKSGQVEYWVSDDTIPVDINPRIHGLGQSSLLKLLGGIFLGVMLLTAGIWIGGAILRRRFRRPLLLSPLKARLRLASRIGVVIYLLLIVGWVAFFASLTSLVALVGGEPLGRFIPLYVLGVLAILGSLAMIANAALRLRLGPGGILARGGELLLGLAGIYGIWGVIHLGLASFTVSF
jgi:CubicO group peptidase (beta-lactamase class C family)